MAGRERDWMDYAQLASNLAQNAQLSSIGDQLAALKAAESQKQFAEFEVTVIRQILFRIEDSIRYFTKHPSYSPQGKMLGLMRLTEMLAAFNEPSFYRNYEDKDRHTALTTKVDEAVMEIARSVPPADLAEFNEAVAWKKKLPLLAQAMQLSRDTEAYLKQMEKRPQLEMQYENWNAKWQADKDAMSFKLDPLEKELGQIKSQLTDTPSPQIHGCVMALAVWVMTQIGFSFLVGGFVIKKGGERILFALLGVMFLGLSGWWVVARIRGSRAIKVQLALRTRAEGIEAQIAAILPPKPEQLPERPTKPSNEAAEQFMLDEKLGSTFQELEATFTHKRALVERVLEADAGLEKNLSEMDAGALLHRTAQEIAAKMGLPLPSRRYYRVLQR